MTSKERFMAVLKGQIPDRVPVIPDISNYIPCKYTGLPFWDIYFTRKATQWRAYMDVCDYYGVDHWVGCCVDMPVKPINSRVEWESNITMDDDRDAAIRTSIAHTPDGDLESREICFRGEPPAMLKKLMNTLEDDWAKYRWLLQEEYEADIDTLNEIRAECDKRDQAFSVCLSYPGFQNWNTYLEDALMALSVAHMDTPDVLEEWAKLEQDMLVRKMELAIAAKPDYITFGGSGTITMASPDIAMKYAIPAIKVLSRMAKDAGIPTVLHSCGKSRILVEMLVEHTDVTCINPLEIAPMGDVDLAEVKAKRGKDIVLMGNLHTTDVMLRGSVEDVRREAIQALRDAGEGGNFILSTGDQCGPDTPPENLFALVEVAKEFGVYDQSNGTLPALA